jgi:hypothetical protein
LLSARETLFAGLTATGGALFGAWLAFVAVQDQIGMARHTEALARQVENEQKIYAAGRDCDRVKSAHGYASALVSEFPPLDDPKVAKGAFAERLLELRRTGILLPGENAIAAPDGLGDSLKTVMNRIRTFADNLQNETKDLSADVRGGIIRSRDSEVIESVKNLASLSNILGPRVLFYEQRFSDFVAQSGGPD